MSAKYIVVVSIADTGRYVYFFSKALCQILPLH